MPREKTSVSREDYLKAIWEMVQEEQEPISARLAEELGVTPPAVTAAVKRMTRDGLLRVERSGRIALTRKGSGMADRLAMRHQLAEKLLTEVIGLDWTEGPHPPPLEKRVAWPTVLPCATSLPRSFSPKSSALTGRRRTMRPSALSTEFPRRSKSCFWRDLAPKVAVLTECLCEEAWPSSGANKAPQRSPKWPRARA